MIEFAFAAALMAQDDLSIQNVQPDREYVRCAEAEFDGTRHADCYVLVLGGGNCYRQIRFDYDSSQFGERITMYAGSESAHYSNDEVESFFYPSLDDINADGFEDIRIPLITGNVNTEYAIFMGTEDGFTHQPWQVSGFAVEAANDDGLIVARSRSSAAESYAEFYRFDGEGVIGEATVLLSFMNVENPDDGPDCSLVNGGETEGEAYYCGLALNP